MHIERLEPNTPFPDYEFNFDGEKNPERKLRLMMQTKLGFSNKRNESKTTSMYRATSLCSYLKQGAFWGRVAVRSLEGLGAGEVGKGCGVEADGRHLAHPLRPPLPEQQPGAHRQVLGLPLEQERHLEARGAVGGWEGTSEGEASLDGGVLLEAGPLQVHDDGRLTDVPDVHRRLQAPGPQLM